MAQKEEKRISPVHETEEDIRLRKRREKLRERKRQELLRRKRQRLFYRCLFVFLVIAAVFGVAFLLKKEGKDEKENASSQSGNIIVRPGQSSKEETSSAKTEESAVTSQPTAEKTTETEETLQTPAPTPDEQAVYQNGIRIPSWVDIALLEPNYFSRPTTQIDPIKNIVIHWVGNAGSSARDNRDYFDSLRIESVNPSGTMASSHFVVGLKGEVVECIPLNEVAYAQGSSKSPYNRNTDCISIETCHPDWEGKFNDTTYASVVKLSAYLCQQYGLSADCLMRHHDVSGKDCPKYYVEHPDAWEQLKADVAAFMKQHPDIENEFP